MPTPREAYEFGPFRLDAADQLLYLEGQPVSLTPKTVQTLLVLVRQRGHVVDKEELIKTVWPDTFVEEGGLTRNISVLRKVFAEAAPGMEYIETHHKRGYRFVAPVRRVDEPGDVLVIEKQTRTIQLTEEVEEIESDSAGTTETARALPAAPIRRRTWVYGAIALGLLVAAAAGWRVTHNTAASSHAPRVVPLASYPGELGMPSFAPDGERIAFAWTGPKERNWDIYVKTIGSDPPLRLTSDPGDDGWPTWSPDGREIAFLREKGHNVGLYVVGALGGPERRLIELTYGRYYDLDWSPDGRFIAFAEKTDRREDYNSNKSLAVFLLSVDTLEKRQLTFPQGGAWDQRFEFSPDGRTLAFLRHDDRGSSIWLIPAGGGEARKTYDDRSWIGNLAWTADGQGLIFNSKREGGSKLFRIAVTGGAPQPLPFTEDSAYYHAIAPRGDRMAYVRGYDDSDLWQVALNGIRGPATKPRLLLGTPRVESYPEYSPDGRRIAFFSEGTGKYELWICQADGRDPVPLTDFSAFTTYAPSWSPDGAELVFASVNGPASSKGGVFVIHVETRQVRRLTDDYFALPWWSRDGRWIYLASERSQEMRGIWKIPAQGGTPVHVTDRGDLFAQESFDGRTLYYSKYSGGIWKMSVDGGEEALLIPDFSGVLRGYWRVVADGIYFLNRGAQPGPAIEFFEFAGRRSHRVAVLQGDSSTFSGGLTVSPDRRSIVYSQQARTANEIMLVENFR